MIVAPILLLLTFGAISYGVIFGAYHSVQQLAAEAARASIAGLDDAERAELARRHVRLNAENYAFLDVDAVSVEAGPRDDAPDVFEVAVEYDASGLFVFAFDDLVPLPSSRITRRAAVIRGGY